MDSLLTRILVGLLLVTSAQAELLLSPKLSEYQLEGMKFKRLAFADGATTVTYQSPRGWEYSGNAAQLTLHPPNRTQAEATVTRVPLPQPGRFDDESVKKLVSEAIALLPKGSENISVVSQEKNPLIINDKETFLVTLNYTLFGQKFGRSILILNRDKEQIRSQLTCREADFKELQEAFRRSQYTWKGL